MLANKRETHELLKWLSEAMIAIGWFSGVQAGIIVAEHANEFKCIK